MTRLFQDAEHLFRMAGLFCAGILLFLGVRSALVPDDFGRYGHYRAGALGDNADRPLVYAGREACAACHDAVVQERAGSGHAGIGCETCHGALGAHVADPASVVPVAPEGTGRLCLNCHLRSASKPSAFPQVEPREHAGEEACNTCHRPHHPALE